MIPVFRNVKIALHIAAVTFDSAGFDVEDFKTLYLLLCWNEIFINFSKKNNSLTVISVLKNYNN